MRCWRSLRTSAALVAFTCQLADVIALQQTGTIDLKGPSAALIFSDFGMAAGGSVSFDVAVDEGASTAGVRAYIIVVGRESSVQYFEKQFARVPANWEVSSRLCRIPAASHLAVMMHN